MPSQCIDRHEAYIVPVIGIFGFRVTETGDQQHAVSSVTGRMCPAKATRLSLAAFFGFYCFFAFFTVCVLGAILIFRRLTAESRRCCDGGNSEVTV